LASTLPSKLNDKLTHILIHTPRQKGIPAATMPMAGSLVFPALMNPPFHLHMHENKPCPRCGRQFACKPGNIAQCQCFEIKLTEEEKKLVSDRYDDCLCGQCLKDLKNKQQFFLEKFRKG
jgi:hypothetical protein